MLEPCLTGSAVKRSAWPVNLLFITSDHQRADSIGLTQAGRVVTPHLNALAAQGTHFTRAYSACPLCVPARAALATGLRPARNGVTWNDWQGRHARDVVTLHERLATAGYTLGHTGMDHVRLGRRLRERAPFAVWLDETDHEKHLGTRGCNLAALEASGPFRKKVTERIGDTVLRQDYSTPHVAAWPFAREDFRDEFFTRRAEAALAELAAGDNPFALFVNLWAPHPPFYVPPELMNVFPPDDITLPENIGRPAEGEPRNRREGVAAQLAAGIDEAGWRRAWSAHLALTHMVDLLVGRLLTALERHGVADDTLIVFTSDHGEHLGQHALYQKMELYEPAARVPLIFAGAGLAAQPPVATPVSHLDVVPTVLTHLGLSMPAGLDGRPLNATLHGGDLATVPVFTQFTGNSGPSVARYAVIHGDHKLILDTDDQPELYDLAADPLEMQNRAGDPALAQTTGRLAQLLTTYLAAGPDVT